MAAMLVLVSLLILMMATMMKSDAPSAEIITACSGEAVLLPSGLQVAEHIHDIRWTHPHLLISLTNKICHHRRCELLRNGSLRFSRVQPEDSGNYTLQLFDKQGTQLTNKSFVLRVKDVSSSRSHRNSGVMVSVLTCGFFLLLLINIILFILMRRQSQRLTTVPQQDVYVEMQGNLGSKGKETQSREEESHYVSFPASVSMETPITQQKSEDVEGIYV